MKTMTITHYSVLRQIGSVVGGNSTIQIPLHLSQDGFYYLEKLTGCTYDGAIGSALFRVSVVSNNRQIFQEFNVPPHLMNENGFYPIESLSPGVVTNAIPRLEETMDVGFLLPPRSLVIVELRNLGSNPIDIRLCIGFRKIKNVVWDGMLDVPRVESLFADSVLDDETLHDDVEPSYSCGIRKC